MGFLLGPSVAAAGGLLGDKGKQKSNPWVVAAIKYGSLADADAKANGYDSGAELILKLIQGESHFNPGAVSSAGARGAGQFMPGTRAAFLSRYGVDAWSSSPDTATKAVALFLRDNGLKKYNPGGGADYLKYIKDQNVTDLATGGLTKIGGLGVDIPNPLEAFDAAVEVAKFMLDHLTHPQKMAALIVKVWAYVLRMALRAYWEYVLQPMVSWGQRAVTYYWEEIMSYKKGESNFYYTYAGLITTAWWSLGFSVLYMKMDPEAGWAANPRETLLGRGIKAAQVGVARQSLTKPKDVEKKTPKKPDESTAEVEIDRVGEVKVKRRRPVQVSGTGATGATDATDSEGATTTNDQEGDTDGSGGRSRAEAKRRA